MGEESPKPASAPTGAVFLSYASQDVDAARRICEALRGAGIEVWFDQSELRGGDAWDQKIRREIRDCALFIPVVSANTATRHEGYFRLEWDLADQRTHRIAHNRAFIVPVCVDTSLATRADTPESFQRVQWTRLPGGDTPSAFVERIRRLLSPELSAAGAWSSYTPGIGEPARTYWRSQLVLRAIIAVVIFAALAYFVADKFWISKRSATTQPTAAAARAGPAPFNPPPHSIAVLPFVNMSGDKDQEYFSDGLTEELLNSLARIKELQVSARTSSFSFKGKDTDISTIAHKLNVGSVLEGSVRRSGHMIRVTAQLNDAVTGFHLWSQTYDRDLGDVLRLQTDISNAVAEALKVTLLGDVGAKVEVGGTRSAAALDAYLRGLRLARIAQNESGGRAAIEAYSEAIRLDPGYALAFAARAIAYSAYIKYFTGRPGHDEEAAKARGDAERAIALAPEMAEGHVALSQVLEWNFLDFVPAVEECRRAVALGPGSAPVVRWCSGVAADMGQFDSAIAEARRAIALDPLNPLTHLSLANVLQKARRYEESIPVYGETLKLEPPFVAPVYGQQGLSYYLLGKLPMARSTCETTPQEWWNWVCLAVTLHALGLQREAEAQIPRLVERGNRFGSSDSMAYQFAQIDAQWGNKDKALDWLEKARRLHDSGLPNLKTDPLLDPLRNEPRFQALARALRFPD